MWSAGLVVLGGFSGMMFLAWPFCTLCLILAGGLGGQGILSQPYELFEI